MKITHQSHPHKRANWLPTWDLPQTDLPGQERGTRSHDSQGRPAKLQMMSQSRPSSFPHQGHWDAHK